MKHGICLIATVAALLCGSGSCLADEVVGDRFFDLVRAGRPAAKVVVPQSDSPIWAAAARQIVETAERWSGVRPEVVHMAAGADLPSGDLLLLGTPELLAYLGTLADDSASLVSRVPLGDEQGFAIEPHTKGDSHVLVIAGRTPRGAFNGAVACRDFLLDATAPAGGLADVFVRGASWLRAPHLKVRGTYLLSIYGVTMKYTAADWMRIIDRFAEDGMNRVCFWLSGHHPSVKYPQLYNRDAAAGTQLTVEGVRDLIRYCHDRDIEFYIGGGVFAWVASHYLMDGHPEIAAVKAGGLCPSQPFARQGNREHFLEMYETWPEADGFMFEIRDEHGECQCEACQQPLDELGSKGYGRAEISWLQEFAREAWAKNPRLRFMWLVGYDEHARDVAYYEQIRRMRDPRFEWLDTRVGLDVRRPWVLPGPGSDPRPLGYFSRQLAHWDQFYSYPVADVLERARRTADEGLYGYVPAFEPGFASASYYSDQIPLPVDQIPYCVTGFAYREATWEPGLTSDELKRRLQQRYFSPSAPARLAGDLVDLHDFSMANWRDLVLYSKPRYGYTGETQPPLSVEAELARVLAIADEAQRKAEAAKLAATFQKLADLRTHLARMDEISAAIGLATPGATPKSLEGFRILTTFIDDTRRLYAQAVPDAGALDQAIAKLEGAR